MSKRSYLAIVQDILNDLSSDEVNSIDDTIESQQVAQIVKSTYFAMMSNRNWPHQKQTVAITSYGDSTLPTHMRVLEEIKELVFINYNVIKSGETRKKYQRMAYKDPDSFLYMLNQNNNDSDNVDVIIDTSGIELLIRNDKAPEFYTTFDDNTLVFDSYDSGVDASLIESKFQALAYVFPTWTDSDDFVPDLPSEAFTALIEESKSKAALKLKQEPDQKAEQEASRQQRWLSRKSWQVAGGVTYPDYGRSTRK